MQKNETGSRYAAAILEYKVSHFRQYPPIPRIITYFGAKFEVSMSNGSKDMAKKRNRK